MAGRNTDAIRKRARVAIMPPAAPKPKVWPAPLGRPPSIENRHPGELEVDDTYQRSTATRASQRLIGKIAAGWDWRMLQPLVVSRREEGFFVIDGQHRLEAAKLRGDIPFLPCCISTYDSIEAEAEMFVRMNKTRKAIGTQDNFHAACASGDATSQLIQKIITGAGFTVSRTSAKSLAPGAIAFTTAIRGMLHKHGERICADALSLMFEAYPDEVMKAGSSTFRALIKLAVNNEAPDRDRLFQALLTTDQEALAIDLAPIRGAEDRALELKRRFLGAYQNAGAGAL